MTLPIQSFHITQIVFFYLSISFILSLHSWIILIRYQRSNEIKRQNSSFFFLIFFLRSFFSFLNYSHIIIVALTKLIAKINAMRKTVIESKNLKIQNFELKKKIRGEYFFGFALPEIAEILERLFRFSFFFFFYLSQVFISFFWLFFRPLINFFFVFFIF